MKQSKAIPRIPTKKAMESTKNQSLPQSTHRFRIINETFINIYFQHWISSDFHRRSPMPTMRKLLWSWISSKRFNLFYFIFHFFFFFFSFLLLLLLLAFPFLPRFSFIVSSVSCSHHCDSITSSSPSSSSMNNVSDGMKRYYLLLAVYITNKSNVLCCCNWHKMKNNFSLRLENAR